MSSLVDEIEFKLRQSFKDQVVELEELRVRNSELEAKLRQGSSALFSPHLEAEMRKLKMNEVDLHRQIADLKNDIVREDEKRLTDLSELRAENERSKRKFEVLATNLNNQIGIWKEHAELQSKELANLRKTESSLRSEIYALQTISAEKAKLEDLVSLQKNSLSQLQEKLTEAERSLECVSRIKFAELNPQQGLDLDKQRHEALSREKASWESSRHELNRTVHQLRERLQNAGFEHRGLLEKIVSLNEKIKDLSSEKETLALQVQRERDRFDQALLSAQEQSQGLAETRHRNEALLLQIETLRHEKSALLNDADNLRSQAKEIADVLETERARLLQAEASNLSTLEKWANDRESVARLEQQSLENRSLICRLETQILEQSTVQKDLEGKLFAAKAEVLELELKAEQLNKEIEDGIQDRVHLEAKLAFTVDTLDAERSHRAEQSQLEQAQHRQVVDSLKAEFALREKEFFTNEAARKRQLSDLELELERRDALIADRIREIRANEAEMRSKQEVISGAKREIEEKDQLIAKIHLAMSEQDGLIARKDDEIASLKESEKSMEQLKSVLRCLSEERARLIEELRLEKFLFVSSKQDSERRVRQVKRQLVLSEQQSREQSQALEQERQKILNEHELLSERTKEFEKELKIVREEQAALGTARLAIDERNQGLCNRESEIANYVAFLGKQRSEIVRYAKELADEIKMGLVLHPLKDYLAFTEREIIEIEKRVKMMPAIAPERPVIEENFGRLVEQREFLRKTIVQSERVLNQRAGGLLKMVNPSFAGPLPPPSQAK